MPNITTKITEVTANSTSVGAMLSTMKRTMVSMPLVPRSIMRLRPPVRRARWKRNDSRCRCSKVWKASRRTAYWPTLANMMSRNCWKPASTTLPTP